MTDHTRSPGSTIAASEIDEQLLGRNSSPAHAGTRHSNHHPSPESHLETQAASKNHNDMTEDEEVRTPDEGQGGEAPTSAAASRRRKEEATAAIQSNTMYIGSKIRHLKKDDGEPLWRKDIQYDFLKHIFESDKAVFTNSYEPDAMCKQTFADLYIDTMARSSKTSKILRDKLLTEHEPATNMAMVCLLVNLGRMNTTLNFFPEMRAQLRTYHAIPSLQAHQDPNSYKQLQDAPRLKSILKGASEDRPEPTTLEKIKVQPVPRTNPVSVIFVLAQFAPKITELHMPPDRDFYDLLMKDDLSSESRATAFLWLLWFYLESDFTEEGAEENPFGPGVDYNVDVRNQGVPRLRVLQPDEESLENVDTPSELEYGKTKQWERRRIIEADQIAFQSDNGPPKRGPKPKVNLLSEGGQSPSCALGRVKDLGTPATSSRGKLKYESDMDSIRSTSPRTVDTRLLRLSGTPVKIRSSHKAQAADGSSPVRVSDLPTMRRPRPLTAHQLAVERHRHQRIEYILRRGIRKKHHAASKLRKQEGACLRALNRLEKIADPFVPSDDEGGVFHANPPFRERGFGGLIQLDTEVEDFGEEVAAYAAAFRRMGRRLERWDRHIGLKLGVMGTSRMRMKSNSVNYNGTVKGNDETEDERPPHGHDRKFTNGHVSVQPEDLDDMEREILGLGTEGEEEEDLDDVDKELLGLGVDETEDEGGNDNWEHMEY